jgi:hypothetical protein
MQMSKHALLSSHISRAPFVEIRCPGLQAFKASMEMKIQV